MEYEMIEIEKGVPVPTEEGKRAKRSKYPFAMMEVGDSFEVVNAPKSFLVTVHVNGKRLGYKFTTRKTENGRRVWRIA